MSGSTIKVICLYCDDPVLDDSGIYVHKVKFSDVAYGNTYGDRPWLTIKEGKRRLIYTNSKPKGVVHLECWAEILEQLPDLVKEALSG